MNLALKQLYTTMLSKSITRTTKQKGNKLIVHIRFLNLILSALEFEYVFTIDDGISFTVTPDPWQLITPGG